jgi:hypothetical protein
LNEAKKCRTCDVEILFAGEAPFRTGGTSDGWKLLFGEWAELGEEMLPLYIYLCPKCGRIELFANEETKRRLLQH